MHGEGTGGGGALFVLLALWIAAGVFILSQDPFGTDEETVGAPGPTVQATEVDLEPTVAPTPTPEPPPPLPECEADACDEVVTRAELAQTFVRMFRLPVTTADFFTDDADVPQQTAINRFAAAGITSGCAENRFCPGDDVTRAQFATFLDRAMELPEADRDYFTDDSDIVHEPAINRLAAAGITSGCGEDRYCPDGRVTRGQLIRFLERAFSLTTEPAA